MAFPAKYSKKGITLATYVDQFCDHRDECSNTKCALRPISEMVVKDQKTDVAYADGRHCEKFRSIATDRDEVVRGADIREVGVWK